MRTTLVATILALALIASACGTDDGDSAAGSGSPSLSGRTFLSQSITEHGEPRDLVDGTVLRIEFRPGEVNVNAGCNHLFGTIESTDGGHLTVSAMGGTEMGCDTERHEQDTWVAAFLESGPRWSLDGDTLVLAHDSIEMTLLDRTVADPDRPLEATRWILDTIFSGESASSLPIERTVVLVFEGDRLSVSGGCNSIDMRFEYEGDLMRITEIASTLVGCSQDLMELDDAVTSLGGSPLDITIVANRLTIVDVDGNGIGLHSDD